MRQGWSADARSAHSSWPDDGACANCATPLAGHWCHTCGQRAADHHRSLRHLALETIEGFTHADGRLWHTLRLLLLRPAGLTRDYLQGRRAREIPPLRLFFVTLLIVFASGPLLGHMDWGNGMKAADMPEVQGDMARIGIRGAPKLSAWIRVKVLRAIENPNSLASNMAQWGERFAFLLAPLSALALRLLFPFRRDVKLYDHSIFAMHSLSFAGIVWVTYILLTRVLHVPSHTGEALFLLLPVHLFVHMRGVYGIGWVSTLWRMWLLFLCTTGIFVVLLTGLAVVSLGTLEG